MNQVEEVKKEFYIYLIQNKINENIYIGETGNPTKRWKDHLSRAAGNKGKKYYVHYAIAKYGKENFTFDIIETHPTEEEALEAETFLIAYFRGLGAKLYNISNGASKGTSLAEETKKKISIAHTGKKLKEETKEKLRIINTGNKHTEEAKKKIGEAGKGRIKSEETKKKMSIILTGRKHSEQVIQNNRLAQLKFNAEMPKEERIRRNKILYDTTNTEEALEKRRGENALNAKLKEKDVIEIRIKYSTGQYTHETLSEEYNVNYITIYDLINYRTWKHIKTEVSEYSRRTCSPLTEKQVIEIREKHCSDKKKYSCTNLAKEYNVHAATIRNIVAYRTWAHLKEVK